MAADNKYREFREIWTCGLLDKQMDRQQTDRHTHIHADCNTSQP